jgi:hypothetical protein
MIIYSLVARGTLVLAEYTSYDGDFPQIARKIIAKTPRTKQKKTYVKENYSFTFCSEDEFTFLCMTEMNTSKEIIYKFLDSLTTLFYNDYQKHDDSKNTGTSWAAQFSTNMKALMVTKI